MTWMKDKRDGVTPVRSFNFVAPDGASEVKNEVLFPFSEKQAPAYAAILAVAIKQMSTFLQPEELTGAATINLTIDAQVTPGAKLHLKLTADGTNRVVTLGAGFAGLASITVKAATTACVSFVFDGTAFVPEFSIPV